MSNKNKVYGYKWINILKDNISIGPFLMHLGAFLGIMAGLVKWYPSLGIEGAVAILGAIIFIYGFFYTMMDI